MANRLPKSPLADAEDHANGTDTMKSRHSLRGKRQPDNRLSSSPRGHRQPPAPPCPGLPPLLTCLRLWHRRHGRGAPQQAGRLLQLLPALRRRHGTRPPSCQPRRRPLAGAGAAAARRRKSAAAQAGSRRVPELCVSRPAGASASFRVLSHHGRPRRLTGTPPRVGCCGAGDGGRGP